MSDETLRRLERRIQKGDATAQEALDRERARLGLGWWGEPLPPGLRMKGERQFGRAPVYAYEKKGVEIELVRVPAGHFIAGAVHERVETVRRSFWIGRLPVTVSQFRAYLDATDREPPDEMQEEDDFPATGMTYSEARRFAKWMGLAIPTEKEWEKAARGEDGREYPWGDESPLADDMPFDEVWASEEDELQPVGTLPRNVSPHGVHDTSGVLWEFTSTKGEKGGRIAKNGFFEGHHWHCAPGERVAEGDEESPSKGFRVVLRGPKEKLRKASSVEKHRRRVVRGRARRVVVAHDGAVRTIAVAGDTLLTGGEDGTVRVRRPGRKAEVLRAGLPIASVALDGDRVYAAGDMGLAVFPGGNLVQELPVTAISLGPEGRIAAADGSAVRVLDRDAKVVRTIDVAATHVAFAGDVLVFAGEDGLHVDRNGQRTQLAKASTDSLAVVGERVVVARDGETVEAFRLSTSKSTFTRDVYEQVGALAASEERIAFATGELVRVVHDFERPRAFRLHEEPTALALRGNELVAGFADGTLWFFPLD